MASLLHLSSRNVRAERRSYKCNRSGLEHQQKGNYQQPQGVVKNVALLLCEKKMGNKHEKRNKTLRFIRNQRHKVRP